MWAILPRGMIKARSDRFARTKHSRTGRHDPFRPDHSSRTDRRRRASASTAPSATPYSRDKTQLVRRLSRIEGQVRGIARMIEREEYCVDILQQTAALRAAVDALALLVLEDHVQGCVRTAAERGEADVYAAEVLEVVRRTLGRPIRGSARARGRGLEHDPAWRVAVGAKPAQPGPGSVTPSARPRTLPPAGPIWRWWYFRRPATGTTGDTDPERRLRGSRRLTCS